MTEFVNMPIPVNMYSAVCALLGGAAVHPVMPEIAAQVGNAKAREVVLKTAEQPQHSPAETLTVSSSDVEVDANGVPFNSEIHTGTKKKDGTWRMKKGAVAETPSETLTPSPESPVADTATEPAGSTQTEAPASAAASVEEDDEFAAFRQAAAKVDEFETAAAAAVPARVWTDADLGVLCNQAAVKMGDPAPVKALIVKYVPAGEVAHSRNVPADKRAAFVADVEAEAGIEFAG